MTLAEIENEFPNGFHDATLLGFAVSLEQKYVTVDVEVDLSSPDRELSEDDPESKCIRVTITGVEYFRMDPPDVSAGKYGFGRSDVSSGTLDEHPKSISQQERENLPAGCFTHWFFLSSWNAFLVVSGRDASYEELAKH